MARQILVATSTPTVEDRARQGSHMRITFQLLALFRVLSGTIWKHHSGTRDCL